MARHGDPRPHDIGAERAFDAALRSALDEPVAEQAVGGVDVILLIEDGGAQRRRHPAGREVGAEEARRQLQCLVRQPPGRGQPQLLGLDGRLHRQMQDAPERLASARRHQADRPRELAERRETPCLPVREPKKQRGRGMMVGTFVQRDGLVDESRDGLGVVVQCGMHGTKQAELEFDGLVRRRDSPAIDAFDARLPLGQPHRREGGPRLQGRTLRARGAHGHPTRRGVAALPLRFQPATEPGTGHRLERVQTEVARTHQEGDPCSLAALTVRIKIKIHEGHALLDPRSNAAWTGPLRN